METKDISGEFKEIHYDKKISKINLELIEDKYGTPLIRIENASKSKFPPILTLHIKEAIELKAMIDNLVVDYFMQKNEERP